jgi:hypothetical protein
MSMTVPVVIGQMLAMLTMPERLVWLFWIWGTAFVVSKTRTNLTEKR